MVWADVPASYHNGAAGFAYADGHEGNPQMAGCEHGPPQLRALMMAAVEGDPPNYTDIRWWRAMFPRLSSILPGQSPGQ